MLTRISIRGFIRWLVRGSGAFLGAFSDTVAVVGHFDRKIHYTERHDQGDRMTCCLIGLVKKVIDISPLTRPYNMKWSCLTVNDNKSH